MDNELVELASIYESPGFLLLALDETGERLGCVGLRNLGQLHGEATGEIRRLFVREDGRGRGLGRSLTERLIADAATRGFDRLVLNSVPSMQEALELYAGLGFEPSEPYVDEPLEDTYYLALALAG